jgi:hypothetical protein
LLAPVAARPAGYDHWTVEQFAAHEEALHKGMKDGLALPFTRKSVGSNLIVMPPSL